MKQQQKRNMKRTETEPMRTATTNSQVRPTGVYKVQP